MFVLPATLLSLLLEPALSSWQNAPPLPATQPDEEIEVWFRRLGEGEDDPVGHVVRIHRTGDAEETLIVRLTFGDPAEKPDATTPDSDFVAPPTTLVIRAGQPWVDVRIPIIDDDEVEGTETFYIDAEVVSRRPPTPAGGRSNEAASRPSASSLAGTRR